MHKVLVDRCGEYHAITDIYCEKKNSFLVEYPTVLVVGLTLAGVIAFMLVGFLGYSTTDRATYTPPYSDPWSLFNQPWPLYLWFVALLITLQVSILRNVRLRARLIATLIVTLICTVVIFAGYVPQIQQLLDFLAHGVIIRNLGKNQWTWFIVNFVILIVFFADTAVRWVRRARGLPATGAFAGRERDPNTPTTEELVSGDLIAGTVLCLLMALVFTATFIGGVANLGGIYSDNAAQCFSSTVPVATCQITAYTLQVPAAIPVLGGVALGRIDEILGLILLPLGLLVLAVSAMLSGLSALSAVDMPDPRMAAASVAGEGASEEVSAQVSLTVVNALRAALDRRLRMLFARVIDSLKNIFWPVLVFVAVFALHGLAGYVQLYLHHDKNTPTSFGFLAAAAGLAVVAVLATICSVALLLFSAEVAINALRFLGWVGFVLLLTFWIFALALFGFGRLLDSLGILVPNSPPTKAFNSSISTAVSFTALLVWAVILIVRQLRARALGLSASTAGMPKPPAARSVESTAPGPRPPQK
jgi:hypothetical protein